MRVTPSLLSDGPTTAQQLEQMKRNVAAADARDAAYIKEHGERAYLIALCKGTLPPIEAERGTP